MLWLRQTAGRLSVQQPACIATNFWDLRAPSNKDCFVVQYKSKPCTQPHIVRGRNLDVKPRYTRARTCWCYCPATLTNMPLVTSFSRPSPLQSCGMQVQVQRRRSGRLCRVHVIRWTCGRQMRGSYWLSISKFCSICARAGGQSIHKAASVPLIIQEKGDWLT